MYIAYVWNLGNADKKTNINVILISIFFIKKKASVAQVVNTKYIFCFIFIH